MTHAPHFLSPCGGFVQNQLRVSGFVTWESLATKEVNVTFSEGLLTIEGTLANGDVYKLENLPLFLEIEPEESKWFKNDRCSSHSPPYSSAYTGRRLTLMRSKSMSPMLWKPIGMIIALTKASVSQG